MKRIFSILFLLGTVFSLASQDQPLPVGKVIDTIRCKANEKQSYALYLPKAYTTRSTWPVIFFYDPAARGSLPVKMYSSLAEKYQCILVGSNNSRNGPLNVTQDAEQAIVRDVKSRFSIVSNGLFISGFSGGARASVFLSLQRKTYAGIIACGAAFLYGTKLTNDQQTPFVEIVGNTDFNFMESVEAEDYLSNIKYPHALIYFQGPHTWPPVSAYDAAIYWQLYKTQLPLKKSFTVSYERGLIDKLAGEINSGELYMANWNLSQSLLSSHRTDSIQRRISSSPLLAGQQKKFPTLLEIEKNTLIEFYKLYEKVHRATNDSAFNESEWRSLFAKAKKYAKSDDILEKQMYERLMNQIRVSCYEDYRGHMELKRYLQASLMAKALILNQPEPQPYVMLARAYAMMERKKDAIAALNKSAELGLSDTSILNYNDFSSLATDKKFIAVKQKVEVNSRKATGH